MEYITRSGNVIMFNQTTDWISGGAYIEVLYNNRAIGTIIDGDVDVEDELQLEVEEAYRAQ